MRRTTLITMGLVALLVLTAPPVQAMGAGGDTIDLIEYPVDAALAGIPADPHDGGIIPSDARISRATVALLENLIAIPCAVTEGGGSFGTCIMAPATVKTR